MLTKSNFLLGGAGRVGVWMDAARVMIDSILRQRSYLDLRHSYPLNATKYYPRLNGPMC